MHHEKHIYYDDLLKFCNQILKQIGLDKFSNECVSKGLCDSSLRGVDSHGIKLLPHYINSAQNGRKNKKPNFKLIKKFPALLCLDADNAFGHAAGIKAINYAIKAAKKYGVSAISVKNSSHSGSMSFMTLAAAKEGYIAFGYTHADALMLSYNGKQSFFGTNPISFACPRIEKEPFCLDMATSQISWNKLLNYRYNNIRLPDNYGANKVGLSTNDPKEVESLLPIGEYKGFGLAYVIEILCGIYSGMQYGRSIPAMFTTSLKLKRKLSQFYIVIRTDGSIDSKKFIKKMQEITDLIRMQPAQKGKKVINPNDKEIQISKKRKKNGILLDNRTYNSLLELSANYNINLKTFD